MTGEDIDQDRFWAELIESGHVVPVVGPDLLTIEENGREISFYDHLAGLLATRLLGDDASRPPGLTLNDVASRHLARGGDPNDIYVHLKRVMPDPEAIPVPGPLLQLAAITPFRLFVSTTFDALLERAINEVRFGGLQKTDVIAYWHEDPRCDLPAGVEDLERPTV